MKDGAILLESPGNLEIITPPSSNPSSNPQISRVVVSNATSADAGLYTCTGINAAGSVSGMIKVEIEMTKCESYSYYMCR